MHVAQDSPGQKLAHNGWHCCGQLVRASPCPGGGSAALPVGACWPAVTHSSYFELSPGRLQCTKLDWLCSLSRAIFQLDKHRSKVAWPSSERPCRHKAKTAHPVSQYPELHEHELKQPRSSEPRQQGLLPDRQQAACPRIARAEQLRCRHSIPQC